VRSAQTTKAWCENVETLNQLRSATVPRDFAFDGGRPWQDQAFEAQVQKPFAALLLNGANAHPAAIDATGGLTGEALWESSRRSVIPRSAQDLAKELNLLLRQAREVLIIDAYFNPSVQLRNSKWLRPIQAIASALPIDGRLNFEIHALNPRTQEIDGSPASLSVTAGITLAPPCPRT
jgi:hypothetical protein